MELSKKDLKRIGLKWECIRRNKDYQKDFQLQETAFDPKTRDYILQQGMNVWFMFSPLPDPQYSLAQFKKRLSRKDFSNWLQGMAPLLDDAHCDLMLHVKNPKMRRILFPEKHRPRGIGQKEYEKKLIAEMNIEGFLEYLKHVEFSFSYYGALKNADEATKQFRDLLKRMRKWIGIFTSKRDSNLKDYLGAYDERLRAGRKRSALRGGINPDAARKQRRYVQRAKALIEKREWQHI